MKINLNIPWHKYALIIELADRLQKKSPQLGKTVMQKMVYLLQEVFGIDCGYYFEFYTYGPFTSELVHDLDYVEHIGGVKILPVQSQKGGFQISPGEKADILKEKGKAFIEGSKVTSALTTLIDQFGSFGASELELRATIVYVERELKQRGQQPTIAEVAGVVREAKPKFSPDTIKLAIDELSQKSSIRLSH
ncbi:MAG: hypothetical protein GY757_56765 [bacterium]|nr:hypothetical protein [bacterium]